MILLLGSLTMGLILSLLAFGVLVTFRVLAFRDLTVDGSVALGGAVAAALLVRGTHPLVATAGAFVAGALAGTVTGVLHTRCKINGLLAGILVMTALYSVNLHVLSKSNVPLDSEAIPTLMSYAGSASQMTDLFGWEVPTRELIVLVAAAIGVAMVGFALHCFFQTQWGLALRATGDNDQVIRALGADVGWMQTGGLALSNGLIALGGGLLVQYQGFADVQMGIGMVVWGLASVIIGDSLVGTKQLGWLLCGAVMGSVLFRLMVALALRGGLNPNDLKLVTATFVFVALVLPDVWKWWMSRRAVRNVA